MSDEQQLSPRDELGRIVAQLLDPADPKAQRLWDHLSKFCHFGDALPLDPQAMQRAEGRREVFLELMKLAARPLRMVKG
jgi:hypothetical protein